MSYSFENQLRTPWEFASAITSLAFGIITINDSVMLSLDSLSSKIVAGAFLVLSLLRFIQGLSIVKYKKNLLNLKPYTMGTPHVPLNKGKLYLGEGFKWLPEHKQRFHLLSLVQNQKYLQKSKLYQYIQAKSHIHKICNLMTKLPFLKPMPDIGGKPWLHGVGVANEKSVYLNEPSRLHTLILGTTQVGKSRLLSILVNQDIRNGEAVIVLDPKGDLGIVQAMYAACIAANRIDDFTILHPGFPKLSAKYNPIADFSNVSEVATRSTSAIDAEGEGKQFKDFAWKFLNITATALSEIGEQISYKNLAFFITRPRQLLELYCDIIMPKIKENYHDSVKDILSKESEKVDRKGNKSELMTRADAVRIYISKYIEKLIAKNQYSNLQDNIIIELFEAAKLGEEYYSKITASLGPVFDKINKTSASEIFSWTASNHLPVITLEKAIKEKKVIYFGLDAMTNQAMSEAIGKALIADLVSVAGRIYKESTKKHPVFVHADEFSEIVQDEFITLLNKSGGAGIRVTSYAQTINDIASAFGSNKDKAKMLIGNFGTLGMLRVQNLDTARIFTECLEQVSIRSSTPSTMSSDKPDKDNGELFHTYNTDTVSEKKEFILSENELFSLPKGQAYFLINGGELYKIRMPMPKIEKNIPKTVTEIMEKVNLRSSPNTTLSDAQGGIHAS